MSSESVILHLVSSIYEAAEDSRLWPVFLEKFANAVRGTSTMLAHYDVERQSGNVAVAVRVDPEAQRKYAEYYHALDCWAIHGKRLLTTGSVVTGQMLCPDGLLERSEIYNDFLRPMDHFHQFCGVLCNTESRVSVVNSIRPQRAGPFGEEEQALLRVLLPHLQRALQLHRRISELENNADTTADALDRLPIGFMKLTPSGKVLILNRCARAILDQNDGLRITSDGLCAVRADETRQLRKLICGAAATDPGGVMTVQRPSMRRSFQILVSPLRSSHPLLGPLQPAVAVFVTDPESQPEGHNQVFSRLFGLTPAEARLAGALSQGKSLTQAAEEFCVSRNTVRSQLQKIFGKTDTKRQAELVRLLGSSPAHLESRRK